MKHPTLNAFRHPLVLASRSPRRVELLDRAGFTFEVIPSDLKEIHPKGVAPQNVPVALAQQKAEAVSERLERKAVVLGADTIVILGDEILGKPRDDEDAVRLLSMLSGNCHTVVSGVYIKSGEENISFSDSTRVWFREIDTEEIIHYVRRYHPLDKAGAYGVQDFIGLVGIERIEGCFYNVMGLPVRKVYKALKEMN